MKYLFVALGIWNFFMAILYIPIDLNIAASNAFEGIVYISLFDIYNKLGE